MSQPTIFFLSPVQSNVGLTSVCLGLLRALDSAGLRVAFFKPIAQPQHTDVRNDRSVHFAERHLGLEVVAPLNYRHAMQRISNDDMSRLMEDVLERFDRVDEQADVIIVEGLVDTGNDDSAMKINIEMAGNLNAQVILVANPGQHTPEDLDNLLRLAAHSYDEPDDPDVVACILNKVGAPKRDAFRIEDHAPAQAEGKVQVADYVGASRVLGRRGMHLLATIPWRPEMLAPRVSDVMSRLQTVSLSEGDASVRRILRTTVCARTLPNVLDTLRSGTLIITPGDREDIIVAVCMAALTGVPLAGLLLTGGLRPDPRTLKLCQSAMETGLPVIATDRDTYHTANALSRMNAEVPRDDSERIEEVVSSIAAEMDIDWLQQRVKIDRPRRLSPAAFRYQLAQRAIAAGKTIVLPEGNEPRTVRAAIICHERGLARCILLGKATEIRAVADAQGLVIPDDLTITDPDEARPMYVEAMVALRRHKGLTRPMAEAQLDDNVVLGTMMLAEGHVDGLVSGAVHTTANTVRPAFQLIKSRPGSRIVSSVFFMCLPEQVVVYGDCAINPDPNAEELADIAIQCADSARLFGIEPRVAMLSYSTGSSGTGSDVDKVREATRLAREMRPELSIDGPMQYDAAVMKSVAAKKAPDSPVAGRATVFVFPDLNTGNTTYKAVQRSANVISIGPMLQGLKKPVNDLSRGALVDDIVFTIALTAIQATE